MRLKRKIIRDKNREKLPDLNFSWFSEYYSLEFKKIALLIEEEGYDFSKIHKIRFHFWKDKRETQYSSEKSRDLLLLYFSCVENEIKNIIREKSIAYWLHILRRFAPIPISRERDNITVAITREILESAIQKYGIRSKCENIEYSNIITPDKILKGRLLDASYKNFVSSLCKTSQLVLTNFDKEEFIQFIEANKLAFEIWKCGAGLRTIGKGGYIVSVPEPEMYGLWMSDELSELIANYDRRIEDTKFDHSAIGNVFKTHINDRVSLRESILLPNYNYNGYRLNLFEKFFRIFYKANYPSITVNFVWTPFEIIKFYKSHIKFAGPFEEKYGFAFETVILAIICLCCFIWRRWKEAPKYTGVWRSWQRAYYGPIQNKSYVIRCMMDELPQATLMLGVAPISVKSELEKAFDFFSLTEEKAEQISVMLHGPLSIFLPVQNDVFFIDYAWIEKILYNLFYRVNLSDQNFKGNALEKYIENSEAPISKKELIANNNSRKQIDASYDLGDGMLAIIECKAIGRSFGYERGDFDAISYRNTVIEKALNEVDDKGQWLKLNPAGRNYNISHYKQIIPIGLTPFIEFIPSKSPKYWIDNKVPRVLSPTEFITALEDGTLVKASKNSSNLITL